MAFGKEFGLTGKELMDWITQKQAEERDDRERVRVADKEWIGGKTMEPNLKNLLGGALFVIAQDTWHANVQTERRWQLCSTVVVMVLNWRKGRVERNASANLEHDREPDTDYNREFRQPVSSPIGGGNHQKHQRRLDLRCRAHTRPHCQECIMTEEDGTGHLCNAMLADQVVLQCGCKMPVIADACRDANMTVKMPTAEGKVGPHKVLVLRDTGCSTVVVRRDLVPDEALTGAIQTCVMIDGTVRRTPVAIIEVDSPFFKGTVKAICMRKPLYGLIIGNIPGASLMTEKKNGSEEIQAVVTRQQQHTRKENTQLKVAEADEVCVDKGQLQTLQREDETLDSIWRKQELEKNLQDDERTFLLRKELLCRKGETNQGQSNWQIVVPIKLRNRVLRLAHESILAGHQGIRRTQDRVRMGFWWPGMQGDIIRFVRSCDICQRSISKGEQRVPLQKVPIVGTPFQRVAIDLIGPIRPASDRKNRFILTLVDYATRYPEAAPLMNAETETVAEALVTMFSRVGVPNEVLSDQGPQLMSRVMKEVSRLLSFRQLVTTPYHPQCNGLVERFNGTLKTMLVKMCEERPKDWDRYIAPLLFAYREVPQESLGFSPFELLYGRNVRGPMTILKELWTQEEISSEMKTTYEYVLDLRNRLQQTCDLAHQELIRAQKRQHRYYNVGKRGRSFNPGDRVLLLLTAERNKLLMKWKGPFRVLEKTGPVDYKVQLPNRTKIFHVNLLKRYYDREEEQLKDEDSEPIEMRLCAAILETDEMEEESDLCLLSSTSESTWKDVKFGDTLTEQQLLEAKTLVKEFEDIFTDKPGITNLVEHTIHLTTSEPIRAKAYSVPHALKEQVDSELKMMLQTGIIEPSEAPYASPMVTVRKPDGSVRICVDYRRLNKVSVFDPEPVPTAEDIFAKVKDDVIFSKFDLSKGYWQIPVRESDKDVTTFITHDGLYRFNVMPFGMMTAPATFSRMMRRLLEKMRNVDNYLDDVLVHTKIWEAHLSTLREFFQRVRKANLTLNPAKCEIGVGQVRFLGHQLDKKGLSPVNELVNKILESSPPETVKQLRSFLGLVGYYRKFIPNFAELAVPLTDLTKKGCPHKLNWQEPQDKAFRTLKAYVASPPILKAPDFSRPFILQTDASDVGIGAILLQEGEDDIPHPIAFASKKLLDRERHYSTIERECLAIVWGIQKFQEFLYGSQFVLETDHQPLQYLNRAQFQNGRLMRWALALQPYSLTIRAIKGRDNRGADFLSRHC